METMYAIKFECNGGYYLQTEGGSLGTSKEVFRKRELRKFLQCSKKRFVLYRTQERALQALAEILAEVEEMVAWEKMKAMALAKAFSLDQAIIENIEYNCKAVLDKAKTLKVVLYNQYGV